MALDPPSKVYEVHGLSPDDRARIEFFLQGAVYCWCKNRLGEWFGLRDLMGGENFEWEGTPLQELYYRHERAGAVPEDAIQLASVDGGRLLKRVLDRDVRTFQHREEDLVRKYCWIP